MLSRRIFVRASAAAVALVTIVASGTANADLSPAIGWGVGENNRGFGLAPGIGGPSDPFFGVGSQPWFWGVNPHHHIGVHNSWLGTAPQQTMGIYSAMPRWGVWPAQPQWGFGPFGQSLGFAPPWIGMNPQPTFGPWGHWFGPNPQPVFNPYANPYLGSYPQQATGVPMMSPYVGFPSQMPPAPMPSSQLAGAEPINCSINAVPALTKSVNDCEKAGGEVVKKPVASTSR